VPRSGLRGAPRTSPGGSDACEGRSSSRPPPPPHATRNENTNGLLRQYLPRTLDFRTLTQTDLDAIADQLNERPRQTLGFEVLH
jgi:hypothetical protein